MPDKATPVSLIKSTERKGIAIHVNDYRSPRNDTAITATIALSYFSPKAGKLLQKRSAYLAELIPLIRVLAESAKDIADILHAPLPDWIETILADNTRLNAIKRDKPISD